MHEDTLRDTASIPACFEKQGVDAHSLSPVRLDARRASDLQPAWSFTTNAKHELRHDETLDFAFFVHARTARDILCTYPHLAGHDEDAIYDTFDRHPVHVASPIRVRLGSKTLHGELIGVPLHPKRYREQLRSVRASVVEALRYCKTRRVKIVGLGALLPSMTQYGRALVDHSDSVGITTGHSFTACCIAQHVRRVEELLNSAQSVAIIGAAGSTGRAAISALMQDGVARRMTLVDLPERLPGLAKSLQPQDNEMRLSSDLLDIRRSSVVVCVTNSPTAILRSEHLSPGCIVIDDAQPENITFETVRERPDVIVIKCLAKVPNLDCPFDFGLLPNASKSANREITFTCLAETIALAASGRSGHFTIGSPSSDQIQQISEMAARHGIGIAPFHSFPEIGSLHQHPRFC